MEEVGKHIVYIIINNKAGPFQTTQKEKQKRWRKVLTKGEKGGILTKLSREGR